MRTNKNPKRHLEMLNATSVITKNQVKVNLKRRGEDFVEPNKDMLGEKKTEQETS